MWPVSFCSGLWVVVGTLLKLNIEAGNARNTGTTQASSSAWIKVSIQKCILLKSPYFCLPSTFLLLNHLQNSIRLPIASPESNVRPLATSSRSCLYGCPRPNSKVSTNFLQNSWGGMAGKTPGSKKTRLFANHDQLNLATKTSVMDRLDSCDPINIHI